VWRDGADVAAWATARDDPSVVLLRDDETVLTGGRGAAATEPPGGREFKRRLGDPLPSRGGTRPAR
jgi:hypothetical protein